MKRRIAVFTGTRADYGLLVYLMRGIRESNSLALKTIVGGMHFSPEFGNTWQQIEADGFILDARVEHLLSSDSRLGVAKSTGLGTMSYAEALDSIRPDLIVILGDRFEALAIATAALLLNIPIAHLHGGETTEGAYDDAIRHAITKMSCLHFTAAEPYRQRVIQMGEAPARVFNVGALGLDHLQEEQRLSLGELADDLQFKLSQPYFLATYHPATLADESPEATCQAMLEALEHFPQHQVLLTYPNADNGGRKIIELLEKYALGREKRIKLVPSLGSKRYFSALRHAAAMVGNSSSGIIEAPAFGIPSVNIGARQRGRLAASSVLHCEANTASISTALAQAVSATFTETSRHTANPYGKGNAAEQIVRILETHPYPLEKKFHALET